MRSAAYSLLTSLLLLVPISAVPLMAIFGVPQFTPVVASPLDESESESEGEDWNPSARKPSRKKVAEGRPADEELDLLAEETLNWDEPAKDRLKPIKKPRLRTREEPASISEELASDAPLERKPAAKKPKTPAGKPRPLPIPAEDDADDNIVKEFASTSGESDADAPSGVDHADFLRETDDALKIETKQPSHSIPSYRRPRSRNVRDEDRPADKLAGRSMRSAPAGESLTWSKAVVRLNELGIRNFKLEPGMRPGEFTFTCSYTPTNSPHVTRKFEAEADDPLKAVSQVLSQVERRRNSAMPPRRNARLTLAR